MADWKQFVRAKLPPLGLSGAREAEIVEELAQQLEQAFNEELRRGATTELAEARAAAQIRDWAALAAEIRRAERPAAAAATERLPASFRFDAQEIRMRKTRGGNAMVDFLKDLRYAFRMLRKSPGLTAVIILTLGLGIGANSAIFSLVNGVLLRPLPYRQPERLVTITDSYPPGAVAAMQASLKTMEIAGCSDGTEFNLSGRGEASRLYGASVSADFFSVLGASPAMGRVFATGEDLPGEDNVVILSHALWQEEFGSDPNVIGEFVTLEGLNRQIVGVMPADFQFPSQKTQLWVPLHLDPRAIGAYWGSGFMPVIGRLRNDVTAAQAQAELSAAIPRLRAMFPWKMPDLIWAGSSVVSLQTQITGDVRPKLIILLGAIWLVLMIACANVANLLLARGVTRQREMAVRAALGADRWRICRQLLTESVVLATCGGAFGMLIAASGLRWLKAILPADTPRLGSVTIDWRVLAFTASVALLTGVVFGLAPALYAAKIDLTESMKKGGQHSATTGSGYGLRSTLAIAEIALAFVLVIGAGLMVKTLWELGRVNPGFRTEAILTARITPNASYCAVFARCQSFYNELTDRVRALPGVEDAALVNVLPLDGRMNAFAADVEDHPRDPKDPAPVIFDSVITPGYLEIMGIPLLRGRALTPADSAPGAAPNALVTASTAMKFWPNQDAIGKHVKPVFGKRWMTIVGVVGDVHESSLASRLPDYVDGAIYDPYGTESSTGRARPTEMTLVVQESSNQMNNGEALQRVVAGLNAEAPVSEVATLQNIVTKSAAGPRSTMALFAVFAALALALGAVGIYGVVSYSVTQRRPEIGMRMALGAQRRDIVRLIVGHGARLALIGVALGIGGAFALTRLIKAMLFGVSATDPMTFIGVSILLIVVALAACYIPARRAMRVDPLIALRHE
ncbi:MAG TPA: ABC transporter permease [Candidatus Acidoferrales bacterium]|jgi:predicted permease|nr:ABC transporter permease [Candidatus Acidoferrales bacterium]